MPLLILASYIIMSYILYKKKISIGNESGPLLRLIGVVGFFHLLLFSILTNLYDSVHQSTIQAMFIFMTIAILGVFIGNIFLHKFKSNMETQLPNLEKILQKVSYIGLFGISCFYTFKNKQQFYEELGLYTLAFFVCFASIYLLFEKSLPKFFTSK